MEYYDVIIVGAGIAGCGLAYNLKRIGYKGTVLVIDKEGVGANASFIYRNTFKETIKEYHIPYEHKFNGIRIGEYERPIQLDINLFSVIYPKVCKHLLENSGAVFKKDQAINIKSDIIYTAKSIYKFKYLIDCSGSSFFLRKKYNLPLPLHYWIGKVRILKNKIKNMDNYFYYLYDKENYMEDFYNIGGKIMQGDWQWTRKIDFKLIDSKINNLLKRFVEKPIILKEKKIIIPSSPTFPIIFKKCAFLGDSFGNVTTSSSEGIRPILDSSKILAIAIKKNNLKLYIKEWKKKYLKRYIQRLSLKLNNKQRLSLLNLLKNYPKLIIKLCKDEEVKLPDKIKKNIPVKMKFNIIKNFISLKIKYFFMRMVYG